MTLPLFKDLPTPSDMAKWDELAMQDLPPVMLMENASREAWHILKSYKTLDLGIPVLIFMGGGNNGGDGAAIGRLLHEDGCNVAICHTTPLSSLRGAAKEHTIMAKKCGIPFYHVGINEHELHQEKEQNASEYIGTISSLVPKSHANPSIIIDALIGTGLTGDLRYNVELCIKIINQFKKYAFIFSLDIPSGLDGLTGKALPIAVKADVTVTFEAAKPGLYLPKAKEFIGNLHICKIGIPTRIKKDNPPSWSLLEPQKGEWAKPRIELHKGKAGKVAVIGGNHGMTGAPFLSALGALRAGAGLVRVFSPYEANIPYPIPEIMFSPIGTNGQWNEKAIHSLLETLESMRPNAVVLGPGMGRNSEVLSLLNAVVRTKRNYPIILDADALSFFNQIKENIQPQDILTPHPREMVYLMPKDFFDNIKETPNGLQKDSKQNSQLNIDYDKVASIVIQTKCIQKNRGMAVKVMTESFPFTTVLKGVGTLIGKKGLPIALCPKDIPSLAVGGSGDVLSGVIAAVACSGISSYDAACLGVYLHAKSGEILQEKAPKGHLASDIANMLPFAWKDLLPPNPHR